MEGMDLWRSMFSSDFDERDGEVESYSNGKTEVADEFMGDEYDEQDEDEDDVAESEGAGDEKGSKDKGREPDDDAIFDFELEPIVSIAETGRESVPRTSTHLAPPLLTGSAIRPQHRQPISTSSMVGRGSAAAPPIRPTTSQINATDENGVPINYELGVIYICPACGAEYRQQDMWKRHMNEMHQYNTRRGLNFVAIDKLYHRCLECNKRIAMHSRENLLKHKFTHLPYRCTKCFICKREYKYRQDLMVHLRMVHCDEVIAMMRGGDISGGRKTRVREPRIEDHRRINAPGHEDADEIEIKNEVISNEVNDNPTEEATHNMDDEHSRSSSSATKKKRNIAVTGTVATGAAELCEDYINYTCPDCGTDCDTHAQWSQHIEFVHDYVSRRGLNFRCVDMQMQCLECKQFVIPNSIKTLRAHKFGHLPQPEWMRCKLCYKGFTEHHELVTHLLKQHNLESLLPETEEEEQQPVPSACAVEEYEDNARNGCDDESATHWDDAPRRGGRIGSDDIYEPHIDYLCPQCRKRFIEKKDWRTHVVQVHGMNDLSKLNFEVINDRQLKCTECDKIITNAYGIQNAQQHRITHLPYKAYARCRKCHKSYTDRKGLVKHLATYHRVGYEPRKADATGNTSTVMAQSKQMPRKQVVTVANETYEITYLDEEQSPPSNSINEDNDFGEQMQVDEDDYATGNKSVILGSQMSEITASSTSNPNHNRYKCVDCGSLFATQSALKTHISDEHDFMDTQYSAKTFDNAEPSEHPSVELVPVPSTATASAGRNSAGATTIEKNYIYLCPSCGKDHETQFEWRRHINEEHNFDKRQYLSMRQIDKYRYQCTVCKDTVCNSKLKGLQDHHFRHLPYRLYLKCLICGTCYNHKPNIAAHLRARHNICEREPSIREQPAKALHGNDQLKHKDKDKDKEQKDKPQTTSSKSSASPTPGGSRTLKPLPGVLTTRPAGLNTLEDNISYHNAVDLDFITYYCPKCNKNFDSHAFWRKHIVEVHNYNSRQGLNFRQIDNHHFLCLECYKRVTVTHTKGAIGQLQSHKFRHLPYRSFKCLTCNGEFVRKQMFFKHLNRDTNRCDNKIPSDDDTTDQLDNTDIKNTGDIAAYRLICPQCGDGFSTSSKALWREHINIQHDLGKREKLHMRKLSDELFRCNDCEEKLETKSLRELQLHRFQHLPNANYIRCLLCEKESPDELGHGVVAAGFSKMRELQEHIRSVHPDEAENNERVDTLMEDEDDSQQAGASSEASESGQYMPLPPHLLDDDGDEMDFEEKYLLG